MADKSVEIYTTPTCPDCRSAKEFFKQNNVAFTEHDIDEHPEKAEELKKRTGKTLVPTIFIDGKPYFGFVFNRTELEQMFSVSKV